MLYWKKSWGLSLQFLSVELVFIGDVSLAAVDIKSYLCMRERRKERSQLQDSDEATIEAAIGTSRQWQD